MSNVLTAEQAEIIRQAINAGEQAQANDKVVYQGQVRDREEVIAEIDAAQTKAHGITFFDLQDAIEDCVPQGAVRARLRGNMMWTIKARIAGAVRQVVYSMGEHARDTGHVDNFNEFISGMSEAKSSTEYAETMGFDTYGAGMRRVIALISVAKRWEDEAERDASASGQKYQVREMTSFLSEKPQFDEATLDRELQLQKFMLEAELGRAPLAEELEAVEALVRLAHTKRHESRVKNHAEILPLCLRVLEEAQSAYTDPVAFYQLPTDVQASLIEAVMRSAPKVPAQLTSDRRVSIVDLTMGYSAMKRLCVRLADVLADPRFAA